MWDYWINEPVFLDGGIMNIVKRKYAVSIFVKEGLIPFIENAGFRFQYNEVQLIHIMLSLLYRLYEGKNIVANPKHEKYIEEYEWIYQEHEWLYEHLLDSTSWSRFWKKWSGSQDFEEGRFGASLQYKLSSIVWSWIDIEASPACIKLDRELEAQENQEEFPKGKEEFPKGKEDPYLQDNSKRDYQDRHW